MQPEELDFKVSWPWLELRARTVAILLGATVAMDAMPRFGMGACEGHLFSWISLLISYFSAGFALSSRTFTCPGFMLKRPHIQ